MSAHINAAPAPAKRSWIAPLALVVAIGGGGMALAMLIGGGGEPGDGATALLRSGQMELMRGTPNSIGKAREMFEEAAARDPDNAEYKAKAAIADLRLIESSPREAGAALPRASAAAARAAELDPDLAEAQAALGYTTFFWRGDWPGGMAQLDRAVALAPGSAPARHWRGRALLFAGDPALALADLDAAFRLQPADRAIIADRGLALVLAERADEGLAALRRIAREEPQYAGAARNLALAQLAQGNDSAWLEAEERAATLLGDDAGARAAAAGRASLASGRPAALAAMLEILARDGTPYARARILALLGRAVDALAALAQARGTPAFLAIRLDPAFASLRADPRFRELAASLG